MNNQFSFSRLGDLFRLDFGFNKRKLLVIITCLVGLSIFFYTIDLLKYLNYQSLYGDVTINVKSSFESVKMVVQLAWIVLCSQSFLGYFHGGRASAMLMLPATPAEKFLQRFFQTLLVNLVLLYSSLIVVYLLWSLVVGTAPDWSTLLCHDFVHWALFIGLSHSVYFFGSTVFRRHAFWFTSLIIMGVSILSSVVIGIYFAQSSNYFVMVNFDIWRLDAYIYSLAPVVMLLFWWLSWLRFKKNQITR